MCYFLFGFLVIRMIHASYNYISFQIIIWSDFETEESNVNRSPERLYKYLSIAHKTTKSSFVHIFGMMIHFSISNDNEFYRVSPTLNWQAIREIWEPIWWPEVICLNFKCLLRLFALFLLVHVGSNYMIDSIKNDFFKI